MNKPEIGGCINSLLLKCESSVFASVVFQSYNPKEPSQSLLLCAASSLLVQPPFLARLLLFASVI